MISRILLLILFSEVIFSQLYLTDVNGTVTVIEAIPLRFPTRAYGPLRVTPNLTITRLLVSQTDNDTLKEGNIVLIGPIPYRPLDLWLKPHFYDKAAAYICDTEPLTKDNGKYMWDRDDIEFLRSIPIDVIILQTPRGTFNAMNASLYTNVTLHFDNNIVNPWQFLYTWWFTYLIITLSASLHLFAITVSIWGIYLNAKSQFALLHVVAFGLQIIGSLISILYLFDHYQQIFRQYERIISTSGSFAYCATACILVSFFWHETISDNSIKVNRFLKKSKIPFIAISSFIIVFHAIISILMYKLPLLREILTKIISIFFAILALITSIFFVTTGSRVMLQINYFMQKSDKVTKESLETLRWFCIRTFITCFGLLLFFIVAVVFGSNSDAVVAGNVLGQTCAAMSMAIVSSSQSYSLFIVKYKRYMKSSSSTQHTQKTKSDPDDEPMDESISSEKSEKPKSSKHKQVSISNSDKESSASDKDSSASDKEESV